MGMGQSSLRFNVKLCFLMSKHFFKEILFVKIFIARSRFRNQTHKCFSSFFALAAVSFLQLSCSSNTGSAKDTDPKNPDGQMPQTDLEAVPDDGPYRSWKYEWESDVSDEKLKPCGAGKPFANGKCFDEVHFTSESISLTKSGETLTLFEAGWPLNSFILDHYKFSEEEGDSDVLINERIANINAKTGLWARYWFLPLKIKVSKTADKKDLSKAVFESAEFLLSFSYGTEKIGQFGLPESTYFNGSISLCGKTIRLPLTQKSIEETCKTALGSASEFKFVSAFGEVLAKIESLETVLADRRAHSIEIGNTRGVR